MVSTNESSLNAVQTATMLREIKRGNIKRNFLGVSSYNTANDAREHMLKSFLLASDEEEGEGDGDTSKGMPQKDNMLLSKYPWGLDSL